MIKIIVFAVIFFFIITMYSLFRISGISDRRAEQILKNRFRGGNEFED